MALNFNKYAEKGNIFLKHLSKELGHPDDTAQAGRKLRAVLHALRDRLPIEESMQLLAQLPMFLKALYVENWKLHKDQKRIKHPEEFFNEIRSYDLKGVGDDFKNDDEIENAAVVVFLELRKHISLGEMEDIKSVLPKELKYLVGQVMMM